MTHTDTQEKIVPAFSGSDTSSKISTSRISEWGATQSQPSGPAWHWKISEYGDNHYEVLGVYNDESLPRKTQLVNQTFTSPETYEEFEQYLEQHMKADSKKVTTEEQEKLNIESSIRRTKKLVRQKAIMLKVNRLVTCTTRKSIVESEVFRDITTRFFRMCRKKIPNFAYIAVFERHMSDRTSPAKYGSLHLHIAVSGYINYSMLRSCWRTAVQQVLKDGDYKGANIDVSKNRKGNLLQDRVRIASYMSKYINKDMDDEYVKGQKRYWSSKDIPKPIETRLYTVPALAAETFRRIFSDLCGVPIKKVFRPPISGGNPPIYWLST